MKFIIVPILAALLSGCAIDSINKQVVHLEPFRLQDNGSKSISVTKTTNAVDSKHVIGKFYGGLICLSKGDLYWNPSINNISKLDDVIRKKLEENGYMLLGKAYSPFNDEFSKQSEFLLGGTIKDVSSNTCYSVHGAKGELALATKWEVFDTKTKKVVLTIETEGVSKIMEFNATGDSVLTENAFAMAVDNLLANEKFYNLLRLNITGRTNQ